MTSELDYSSIELAWDAVNCVVPKSDHADDFSILKNVSGYAKRGSMTSVMGPSGAGKTTLLDTLAGRLRSTNKLKLTGTVLVNGKPIDKALFQKSACYVMQADNLPCTETVRECLKFSADMRLPRTVTKAEKIERVNKILDELGLTTCADTLVGSADVGIKGISGGQKRRLSVGLELITNPSCIFLDEPTSGLDSEIAVTIMQTLKMLTNRGCTILLTIHQPNSDITELFDDFILMARSRVVYAGPWKDAVGAFEQKGFACPSYKNPTDYFLKLVATDDTAFVTLTTQHDVHWESTRALAIGKVESTKTLDDVAPAPVQAQSSMLEQVYHLSFRNLRSWKRHPMMFIGEGIQYAFLALFVGGMYFGVSGSVEKGVFDRGGASFFLLVTVAFTPPFTAVTLWNSERSLVRREEAQNTYSLASFYIAKTLTLFPIESLFAILVTAVSYFMFGFQNNAGKFFIHCSVNAITLLVAETIGTLFALITKTADMGIVLASLVFIVALSFTGFLTTSVPVYYKWIQHLSFLRYANSANFTNEMNGLLLDKSDGTQVPGEDLLKDSPLSNGLSVAENIAVLAGMLIGLRIFGLIGLYVAKHRHWL